MSKGALIRRTGNESLGTPCEDCKGTGERIINPDWPNGTDSYSDKCSTCGGTGEVEAVVTRKSGASE